MAAPQPELSSRVQRNVAAIAQLEQTALDERSLIDRVSTRVTRFVGSIKFVLLHLVWLAIWVVLNRESGAHVFDPYPYFLLALILSIEAIVLSTFVLMSQNQMGKLAERRAHLDLQINLLSESEMTKVLETLQAITTHLGVPGVADDEEMQDLAQHTDVEHVLRELDEQLPASGPATAAATAKKPTPPPD